MIEVSDILEILPSLPEDNINAQDDAGCVYTDKDGNHCIIGEILVRLDLPLPEIGTENNGISIDAIWDIIYMDHEISDEAFDLLQSLQTRADSMLRSWGETIELTLEQLKHDNAVKVNA